MCHHYKGSRNPPAHLANEFSVRSNQYQLEFPEFPPAGFYPLARVPPKLFGLFPKKGTIAVGTDGDIVLFDPDEQWTIRAAEHHSRMDYTLYEGRSVTGRVKKVFLRGECIVDGASWLGHEGMGQYLRRGESGRI